MKNCIWLKPQVVTQIEFTEWTPDGRFSATQNCFKGHYLLGQRTLW